MRSVLKNTVVYLAFLMCGPRELRGATKGSLPPIGQRIYVIGTDGGKGPIAILRDKASGKAALIQKTKVLRDPTATIPKIQPVTLSKDTSRRGKPLAPAERSGSIRFKKVIVPGTVSRPRIDFAQDPLRLERVDETVSADFFDKIFIPGRDEVP